MNPFARFSPLGPPYDVDPTLMAYGGDEGFAAERKLTECFHRQRLANFAALSARELFHANAEALCWSRKVLVELRIERWKSVSKVEDGDLVGAADIAVMVRVVTAAQLDEGSKSINIRDRSCIVQSVLSSTFWFVPHRTLVLSCFSKARATGRKMHLQETTKDKELYRQCHDMASTRDGKQKQRLWSLCVRHDAAVAREQQSDLSMKIFEDAAGACCDVVPYRTLAVF
ncbi:hypothetical protein MMC24_004907 [Lignoscripta atroalba]|nr:hypothetical protein [Lignoscripta atroalba]